jgi:hypothetical protein
MHFALLTTATEATTSVGLFTGTTAIRATAWFVGETFFSVEVLFCSGECEFSATIAAG